MLDESGHYPLALGDICDAYLAFRPPQNKCVAESAQTSLIIATPGQSPTPWRSDETPYMVEPMNMLGSRRHESVIFAGPARTGKTAALLLGGMTHAVVNDPGDMLWIHMTQDEARRFSKTDLARALDNSPDISRMLSAAASDRNTHDIMFRHGMMLRLAWPTVPNVSAATFRYTAVTDYDRILNRENLGGEGSLFGMMVKRTTTFLSRGMSLAESSPGEPLTDPSWKQTQQHEAPPIQGILGLYNLSDRRRWYWRCPDCSDRFEAEPGLGLFHLPDDNDLLAEIKTTNIGSFARQYARVVCPHCGSVIDFKHRHELNKKGLWLPAGQHFDGDERVGEPLQTTSAGYWLGGVAAAYQKWESLIVNHLTALKAYDLNGSEEKLKQTVNTDQGMPYLPRYLVEAGAGRKTPQELAEDMPRHVVPDQTRCVTATVDVQGGVNARFIVQVHAIGPQREKWLVDRFEIRESKREGMGAKFAPVDPASHPEDWDVLTDRVVLATYRTSTPGREIRVHRTMVDTGGEGRKGPAGDKEKTGVTHNAYAWFRRLRVLKLAGRVTLYKGASQPKAPILRQTLVGSRSKNDKPDIPLYVCNPNLLSDAVDAGLRRQVPGPGYVHFPKPRHEVTNPNGWLPQSFFDELTAEVRMPNGTWQQVKKRNETFDLLRMNHALELQMGLDKVQDWNQVPAWLAPLSQNSEVISTEDRREMKANEHAAPVEAPLVVHRPVVAHRRPRRSAPSPYLR